MLGSTTTKLHGAQWKQRLRCSLLAWFKRHKRKLPWRASRDPYRVWLSEIMLQQTQVSTVVPYFERFVAAFSTVESLAAADEVDVLRHWEGLGYYRRARQLHAAARKIVDEHGGEFPNTAAGILELPGIGRYTAGAIASIAFGRREPILEANTVRLYSRLLAYRGDPLGVDGQRILWKFAEDLLPARDPGELNQALMELGSLICTPREPKCLVCPLHALCPTFAAGLQEKIPPPKPKPNFEEVRHAAVVVRRGKHVLVRQCQPGERWAGLWDFVRFPLEASPGPSLIRELLEKVREQVGIRIDAAEHLTTIRHGVTRFRITLECYTAETAEKPKKLERETLRWLLPLQLDEVPLNTTGRKIAKLVS